MSSTPTHYRHTLLGARVDIYAKNLPLNHTIQNCYNCARAIWIGPIQRTVVTELELRQRSWAYECMECGVERCKALESE
jgi:hypothetical protein